MDRFLAWWARRRTDENAHAGTFAEDLYDPDFVLAGDFNAPSAPKDNDERGKVGRRIVWRIFQTDGLQRVLFAGGAEPGTFILPPWQGTIDHICLSDAAERQRAGPAILYKLDERIPHKDLPAVKTEVYGEKRTEPPISRLSDHRPVTVRLRPTEAP